MEYRFDTVNMYYKNIFLKSLRFSKQFSLEEFNNNFNKEPMREYILSISFDNEKNPILTCDFGESYLLDGEIFGVYLPTYLTKNNYRIINYIEVLEHISNSNFVDRTILTDNKSLNISFASIIARRNLEIIKVLFRELQNNNQLICNFLLRDIIENVKLYLFFIRGAIKEEIITSHLWTIKKEFVSNKINDSVTNNLSSKDLNWNYDVKQIIKNNPSLKLWENILLKVERINRHCNSNIHKLGLSRLLPNLIKNSSKIISLSDVYICVKLFITLIICYDGKEVSSFDYDYYSELDTKPLEDSQWLIAPVIQDFINKEYSIEEKNKLIEKSYMDIK